MIWDAFKLAIASIWQHKLRTFLTIVGVIIGISSVITFLALGEGLRRDVNSEISTLGSNLIAILPGEFDPSNGGGFSTNLISGDILKLEDVATLDELADVKAISPYMLVGGVLRRDQTTAPQALLLGTNSAITTTMSSLEIDRGRIFSDDEDRLAKRVIVLGPGIKKTLFGDAEALGESVQIGKETFEVVGITKVPDSASVLGGSDYSSIVLIPIHTAGEIAGGVKVMRIILTLDSDVDAKNYVKIIQTRLEENHAPEDFTVLTQDDLIGTVNTILDLLTAAVAAIASISLVVAGVGIMNIMLVSVAERTREIGLRKAVGATTSAILWQFLIESIVLSVFGALLAVGIAWIGTQLTIKYSALTPIITPDAILLAVGVGITVGLIFGIAPAYRAARLDPIAALRHD
ncbi:ABC transporter permease [Candidatus Berkelbacteria bacterium]|nr:ABC transporter permease [Candidatus Berkelbacteria bacterium]